MPPSHTISDNNGELMILMINGGDDDDDDDDDNDDDNVSVSVVKNSCRFEYVNMSDFKNYDSPHLFVAPKSLSSNFFCMRLI